jgi:hypothetical protein
LLAPRDRCRFACQHQERRLEGILRRFVVAEHAPADTQNHLPVPLYKGRERGLRAFTSGDGKCLEQLAVSELTGRAAMEERVQMPRNVP